MNKPKLEEYFVDYCKVCDSVENIDDNYCTSCNTCKNTIQLSMFRKDQLQERIKIWNRYKDDEILFWRECEDRDIYLSYVDWLNNLSDKVLDNTDPWKDWLFNYCFEEILKK